MRLRRVLFVTGCLLVATSARAQLKLKLSGRANTKTVLVEASGMVTATNASNVTQSTSWNGYGDFWKRAASPIFPVSGGITVKNDNRNESRNLTSLTFNNTGSSGDLFTMGLNTSVTGGANHSFTLSGSATFQLLQNQTFGAIFGGGTFTTGTQVPPLGSGPILEIMEAPPAEIQVQVLLPGVLPGSNSVSISYGGIFPVAVRISNIGGGFAENVPYTVIIPGTSIASDSPETNLSGTIPLLKAGESRELNFKLALTGIGAELPNYMVQASTTFSDLSLENNTASIAINVPNIYTPTGDGVTTVFNRPPGWPTLLTPGVHYPFPINATSTAPDVTTVLHIKAPPGVCIHNIELDGPGAISPGLEIVHVEAGSFWMVTIPPSPVGTDWPFLIHYIGQSGAEGDLEAIKASTGSTTSHYVEFDTSGALTEVGGLLFEDEDGNGTKGPDEKGLPSYSYSFTIDGQTIEGVTDLDGEFCTYCPQGSAGLTVERTGQTFAIDVPAGGLEFADYAIISVPDIAVTFNWSSGDPKHLLVRPDEAILPATLIVRNLSDLPATNVPMQVYYDERQGFANIVNPYSGETDPNVPYYLEFAVPSIPPQGQVEIAMLFNKRGFAALVNTDDRMPIVASCKWEDKDPTNNSDTIRITTLSTGPFGVRAVARKAPVPQVPPAGTPVEFECTLGSNGGTGTTTVRVACDHGVITSVTPPPGAVSENASGGTLWEFDLAAAPEETEIPFEFVVVLPSSTTANLTVTILSAGEINDTASVNLTSDATPTVLVSGQVFYDANSNGMFDGGERLLPNWPVKVADGAGNTFNLQADGSGNWGVFVAAGSGPGQASPGAGGGGAPGAGFGFVPLPGADVDLDVVVGPLELSGRAFVDRDGDGVYTPGTDVPFPGLTAYLGMSSATGQTTTTDADGRYLFTLPPDTPGFLLNPAETGGVARAHIVGLDEPPGFVVPRPVFGVHYVPDFTAGILPLVTTPLNALDFVMGVEPNLLTIDPPTAANPKIRWPKRLGPNFIPEFNTTLAPNGWMEITAGRTEDADFYYADLPAAPDGQLFVRLRRPVNTP